MKSRALAFPIIFLVSVGLAALAGKLPVWLPGLYLLASLITFAMYGSDKARAKKGKWRIPEGTLHLWELAGGWPGALIAQQNFRHKTRKLSFKLVLWFIVLLHIGALGGWIFAGPSAHLVEIDLLRRGTRVPMVGDLPAAPYFVFVSRAEDRPTIDVWPIQLHERLPTVQVPLLPGDPDLALDLQEAFQNIYDLRGFDLLLDYSEPPEVPLAADESRWARGVLDVAMG